MHIAKKFYAKPELSMRVEVCCQYDCCVLTATIYCVYVCVCSVMYVCMCSDVCICVLCDVIIMLCVQRFALQRLQLLLHDHPVFEQQVTEDMGMTML